MSGIISIVACTGCRIRRKKCDRAKPICSGCQSLNVPKELCFYPEHKSSYRGKNSKGALKELRLLNKKLYREQLHYKHKFEDCFTKSITRSELASIPVTNKQPADFMRHDLENIGGRSGHCGLLSWDSLKAGEPSFEEVDIKLNDIFKQERMKSKNFKIDSTSESDTEFKLSKIRNQITAMSLGIDPINIDVIHNLLKDVVNYLPNYKTVKLLFAKYFQLNKSRGLEVDKKQAIMDFHRFLSVADDGSLKMRTVSPKVIVECMCKLSLTLMIIIYPIIFQHYGIPQEEERNYLRLVAYADIMCYAACPFLQQKGDSFITFEAFQTITHIRLFQDHFPHGKVSCGLSSSKSLSTRATMGLVGVLGLDQNIDIKYSNKSHALRNSMKSFYYFYVLCDLWESFDKGLPPKFKSDNLIIYPNYGDSKILHCLKTLSRVLERFHKFESLLTIQNPCGMIENDFIYELQAILHVEFEPFSECIERFQNMDLKKITADELIQESRRFEIVFFIYSVIMSLYSICLRKTKQFDPENLSMVNRYTILSLKYGFLSLLGHAQLLKGFQRILDSPEVERLLPLEPILRISSQLTSCLERSCIVIGSKILEFSPFDINLLTSKMCSNTELCSTKPKIDEESIFTENICFFKMEELENCEIDRNNDKLLEKFSAKMLDHKVLLLKMHELLVEMKYSLVNEKYNVTFMTKNIISCKITRTIMLMIHFILPNGKTTEVKATEDNIIGGLNSRGLSFGASVSKFFDLLSHHKLAGEDIDYNDFDPFGYPEKPNLDTDSNSTTKYTNTFKDFELLFDDFAEKVNGEFDDVSGTIEDGQNGANGNGY